MMTAACSTNKHLFGVFHNLTGSLVTYDSIMMGILESLIRSQASMGWSSSLYETHTSCIKEIASWAQEKIVKPLFLFLIKIDIGYFGIMVV